MLKIGWLDNPLDRELQFDDYTSQVHRALESQRLDDALQLARSALSEGFETPLFLNLRAFQLEGLEQFEEALHLLERALDLAPDDALILSAVGRCLSKQGRYEAALAAYDQALRRSGRHAPALFGRGEALSNLAREPEALECYRRAAEIDPAHPGPPGALAEAALRRGDLLEAQREAERALSLEPTQPAGNLVLALLQARKGDHAGALATVEGVARHGRLSPLHEASFERLRGDELDRVGRYDEAFDAYRRANAALWRVFGPRLDRSANETGEALARRVKRHFAAASPRDWGGAAGGSDVSAAAGHVFLVGFVRSGTTLLEQVLASHPRVVALEERATLRALVGDRFASEDALKAMAAMGEVEAAALRRAYWEKVRSFGVDPEDRVFVDKAPLTSLWQPLIAKLFPEAKVLFARRDPRDVVLSSFRHAFQVNALTGAFSDLATTASFYDSVMDLAQEYARVLPLRLHVFRHEDVVVDFDREVRKICEVLEITWDDRMQDFSETAATRDIRTPSAAQVRERLNSKGVGHWRRYRAPMRQVLPVLAPWVERFGYDAD